jgi:hypothetical protein
MRPLVVALAGVTSWFALPASGQPLQTDTAALNWNRLPGAEACPDLAELARRVAQHLKRDAFVSPAKAHVLVDASIHPAQPGFRVRIVLSSSDQAAPGERELVSPSSDCNDAVDSAALAIALMLDPEALSRSDEPAPAAETSAMPDAGARAPAPSASATPPIAPKPAKTPPPLADAAQPTAPSRQRRLGTTQLAVGALVASDQVPGNSFGVMAGLRRVNPARSLGLNLGASYLAPRRLPIRTGLSEAGGQFSLFSAELSGVWSPLRQTPLAVSIMGGPQVARVFASGFGFTASNRDVGSWMISGTVEGELAWALSEHWDLLLRLGLGLPFWRDSFEASVFEGTTTILEPAPFFGTFKLALAVSP